MTEDEARKWIVDHYEEPIPDRVVAFRVVMPDLFSFGTAVAVRGDGKIDVKYSRSGWVRRAVSVMLDRPYSILVEDA